MKVFIKVSESDKPKMLEDLRAARVHATERIKVVAQQHPDGRDADIDGGAAESSTNAESKEGEKRSALPELRHIDKPHRDGWFEFDRPISYLCAGKGPYVSRDLMQFPVSHPDDGYIDVTIQETVSHTSCETSGIDLMNRHIDLAEGNAHRDKWC